MQMRKPEICKGKYPTWKTKPEIANTTVFTEWIKKKQDFAIRILIQNWFKINLQLSVGFTRFFKTNAK